MAAVSGEEDEGFRLTVTSGLVPASDGEPDKPDYFVLVLQNEELRVWETPTWN